MRLRHSLGLTALHGFATVVQAQQIWDMWQTTWSRSPLFEYNPSSMGSLPINFGTPGQIGDADIVIDDSTVFQQMYGFGGSLTDSSALTLSNMKSANFNNYWSLMWFMFDVTDGADSAGLSYIRVPLGASDFSANIYSFDDSSGDTSLSKFTINTPSYVFAVLKDILFINPAIRVHILPWSPPGWMKDSGSMDGGSLQTQYESVYALYLLKSLQGFQQQGIPLWGIGIQNEPDNSNPTYPTCTMPYTTEAAIGIALRQLMDLNGFSNVKIIGYEHNWDDMNYPINLLNAAPNAFSGASFHCYSASTAPQNQQQFTNQFPNKEVYFTECTGTYGSDWWSDIKWYMGNLFSGGSVTYGASTGGMFNIAADGNGNPKLPGTNSCGGGAGCRPIATVNSDGSFSVNQEFFALGQAAKAIIPRDAHGPYGQRIKVTIGGTLNWAAVVSAFVTTRLSSSDWNRYSLVVMNWHDNASTSWNPQPLATTIEFRGAQARITFPVGVTTLWWYAPKSSFNGTSGAEEAAPDGHRGGTVYGEMYDGSQVPLGSFARDRHAM